MVIPIKHLKLKVMALVEHDSLLELVGASTIKYMGEMLGTLKPQFSWSNPKSSSKILFKLDFLHDALYCCVRILKCRISR